MMRFGLLGHPVSHSLSPAMHEASFRALGIDASYEAIDVLPEALAAALRRCAAAGFSGLNVTAPHKQAALELADRLDASAERLGAVNTIRFDADGKTTGFNTDAAGFLDDLLAVSGLRPAGLRVMIAGCGGAGRALAAACALAGCARLDLANRTPGKAQALAERLLRLPRPGGPPEVEVVPAGARAWRDAAARAGLIVQCTPSGQRPGDPPLLPPEAFRAGQFLYDIVYTSPETPTMRAARAAGARAANGAGMLARQGAAAFKIWTGRDADLPAMRLALDSALKQQT